MEEQKKLQGKTFVITGKLSSPRESIKKEIESHGGRVVGAISAKTDYLIVGEKVGNKKMTEVMRYEHIKMISENEFRNII